MHPILYTIPGLDFPLRSFGIMLAAGFLLGSWILGKLAERYGDDPKQDPERLARVTVWILFGVVLGARLLYIIVEVGQQSPVGKDFVAHPIEMLKVWNGGLVMYGGLFGAIALGMWKARMEKLRVLHALDLGLIAGFIGLAVGRIGCYLVGDDYGSIVPPQYATLPWPITLHVPEVLPEGSLFGEENAGQVLWATQNWMSIKALIVAAIGYWTLRHRRYAGQVALTCLFSYAILRGGIEFFRGDSVRGLWFGGAISTSQLISLVSGGIALTLLTLMRQRREGAA
ncbi:MAG: prolipoprotein diacylglyceryl transferase [Planctomycetia bacterium]